MKKHFYFSLLSLLLLFPLSILAQRVDTVLVHSPKMGIDVKNVVILPENYTTEKQYPVLYLLHGYGGNEASWIKLKPSLPQDATQLDMIVVCPDGKKSWYWDSPVNPQLRYETFVSDELVNYIDSNYSTVQSPKGRAVTGLSMGGHGGLWLGFRHQDVFGACGSMSGGVDIRPFPNNWDMKKAIGTYKDNSSVWDNHTVMEQVNQLTPGATDIIIDCGVDDFFYEVNEALHQKLLYNNIPHDYITRPGKHNGEYWDNAIDYQILYFSKFFNNKK